MGEERGRGESVSPLFESAALPAVFERLLLLATTTATATTARTSNRSRGGPSCTSGGAQQQQQQQRGLEGEGGAEEERGQVRDDGDGDEALLGEAKAGLDELLRWALPSLVSLIFFCMRSVYSHGVVFVVHCCCGCCFSFCSKEVHVGLLYGVWCVVLGVWCSVFRVVAP